MTARLIPFPRRGKAEEEKHEHEWATNGAGLRYCTTCDAAPHDPAEVDAIVQRLNDTGLWYEPAIPEPFWFRPWWALLRWRPGCYEHNVAFKDQAAYEGHWRAQHLGSRAGGDRLDTTGSAPCGHAWHAEEPT